MKFITDPIDRDLVLESAEVYQKKISDNTSGLSNVVCFIDSTMLAIARPKVNISQ